MKCGFNLKGAAAPKFKGTVLMVNPGPAGTPGPPKAAGAGLGPPGQAQVAPPRPFSKGTMLGVAPPPGSPLAGAPLGAPPPPAALPGALPPLEPPAAPPLQGTLPGLASQAQPVGAPIPLSPPAGQPHPAGGRPGREAVNPLAGTMTTEAFHANAGPADPPPRALGLGPTSLAPIAPAQVAVRPAGGWAPTSGPAGTVRNPVLTLALGVLCFVYGFFQVWQMLSELRSFRRTEDPNPILFFIPILGWIELWKLPEKVLEAKRAAGVSNPQVVHPVGYLFFGLYFLAADLNEVWHAAEGGSASFQ